MSIVGSGGIWHSHHCRIQNSPVARLELISTHYAHYLIDALEDTLLAFPMGDTLTHFTVGGHAPLHTQPTDYTPIVSRPFYRWGLKCSTVVKSDFTNFIIPPADKMAVAVTDSMT
jgi:hypothetical protein